MCKCKAKCNCNITEITKGEKGDTGATGPQGPAGTLPYKVYSALLTQSGIGNPTPIELENTLGNVIWTRDGFGSYIATLTGSFPQNKTWFISGGTVNIPFGGNTNATAFLYWNDINSIVSTGWELGWHPSQICLSRLRGEN